MSSEDRYPAAARALRKVSLPPTVFPELVTAGCCALCVCRLTGVSAGLSIPHAVWQAAIEAHFGGAPRGEALRWSWTTTSCVACIGMLQDFCTPVERLPSEGTNDSKNASRGRKRKGPSAVDVSSAYGGGSGGDVATPAVATPAVVAPTRTTIHVPFQYASLLPSLCDSVVSRARSSGYANIRDFTLAFFVPHVVALRDFALRSIVCRATNRTHGQLNRDVPVLDTRSYLRAALCDGLPAALDNAPYSMEHDVADLSIQLTLFTHGGDAVVRQFLSVALPSHRSSILPNMGRVLEPYNSVVGFPVEAPLKVLHLLFPPATVSLILGRDVPAPSPTPSPPAPCSVFVAIVRRPIYLIGRYLKHVRGIPQSPWVVDGVRRSESSVEELVASAVLPRFGKCDGVKFHAAGREDMDVRMLGNGRPFVLEVLNGLVLPLPDMCPVMEKDVNDSTDMIEVRELAFTDKSCFESLKSGADTKRKKYGCVVWVSRRVTREDVAALEAMVDVVVAQDTPLRVCHRRTLMTRRKVVHSMRVEVINPHFIILELVTSAGAYVKEFVHGDRGRTNPSLGTLLGCEADILQLDVLDLVYGVAAGDEDSEED